MSGLRDALEPLIARSEATGAKIDVQLALFHELLAHPESVPMTDEEIDESQSLAQRKIQQWETIECSCYKLPRGADGLLRHGYGCPNGPAEPVGVSDEAVEALHNERHFGRQCDEAEAHECLHWREAVRDVGVLSAAGVFREVDGTRPQPTPEAEGGPFRTSVDVAHNIVNQLGDLWHVPVDVRQASNDLADEFVAKLVARTPVAEPAPVASEQLMSDAIRDSLAFEDDMPRGHLLVQIANRAAHALVQKGAVRPLPTREQIAEAIEGAAQYSDGLSVEGHAPDFADAVLALMGGAE